MDTDQPILCFEHCKNSPMFGFSVSPNCSKCGIQLLETTELRLPPFRIPSPFRDASKIPCGIVLKPTTGDFLTEYQNSDNLHIGLTSSRGIVYEFDIDGLRYDKTYQWKRCLAIRDLGGKGSSQKFYPSAQLVMSSWEQYWDFILHQISCQSIWRKEMYNEVSHNCYAFVLAFLRALQVQGLSDLACDRTNFCREFILPKTGGAAKYITLYRKLIITQEKKVI